MATPAFADNGTDSLQPGDLIDNAYVLGRRLGRGGMGDVYACRHTVMGKDYAIKLLAYGENETVLWQRFQTEARAIARLKHPNIVMIHNMGIHRGRTPYYVMDLVEGTTLSEKIKQTGRLNMQESLRIFIQVCHCLNFAHNHGIIHRDIKPANIMLTPDGQVKLLDFGLAKFTDAMVAGPMQGLTAPGEIFGSPSYMSPEQAIGAPTDHRSDIYSTAVALYETLTGALPLCGATALQTMHKIQSEKPASLKRTSGIDFPQDLENLIGRALEKDAGLRYQHIDEMGEDLRRIAQGKPLRPPSEAITGSPSGPAALLPATATITAARAAKQSEPEQSEPEQDWEEEAASNKLAKLLLGATVILTIVGLVLLLPVMRSVLVHPVRRPLTTGGAAQLALPIKETPVNSAFAHPADDAPAKNNYGIDPFSVIRRAENISFRFQRCPAMGSLFNVLKEDRQYEPDESGLVILPADALPGLSISPELLKFPEQLKRFPAGSLRGVRFAYTTPTKIDSCLEMICNWEKLTYLALENVEVDKKGAAALKECKNLDQLKLESTNLSPQDIAQMPCLRRLQRLEIKKAENVTAVLKKLEGCTTIEHLSLDGSMLYEEDLKLISTMKSLQVLSLPHTGINDNSLKALAQLQNLRYIDVFDDAISKDSFPILRSFKKLNYLKSNFPEINKQ